MLSTAWPQGPCCPNLSQWYTLILQLLNGLSRCRGAIDDESIAQLVEMSTPAVCVQQASDNSDARARKDEIVKFFVLSW